MFAQLVTRRYHSHLLIKSVFYHLTLNKAFETEQAPTDFIVGSLLITKLRHLILNCTPSETKENKKHPTAKESIIPNRCQSLGMQQSKIMLCSLVSSTNKFIHCIHEKEYRITKAN